MSEKQAKLKRKATQTEEIKKEKNPKKVALTIAMVVIALAIAGTGGYASWQKIKASLPASTATDTADSQQTVSTVATIAEQNGITAEELLKKCGMEDSGLTADSSAEEFSAKLTVAGYAGMEDKTADELKKEYGLEGESDDELWSDAMMKVKMSKIAEQSGSSFEDFAKNNSLPAEITADTTYGDAMTIMQNAAASTANTDANSAE